MLILALILILAIGLIAILNNQKPEAAKAGAKPKKELPNKASKEEQNWQRYLAQFGAHTGEVVDMEETFVVGVKYNNDHTNIPRQQIIAKCRAGDKLLLIPEPNNPKDSYAVMVCRLSGEQIGYINADLAMDVGARLNSGVRVDAEIIFIEKIHNLLEVRIRLSKYRRRRDLPQIK
jgi:hypothetical protein